MHKKQGEAHRSGTASCRPAWAPTLGRTLVRRARPGGLRQAPRGSLPPPNHISNLFTLYGKASSFLCDQTLPQHHVK